MFNLEDLKKKAYSLLADTLINALEKEEIDEKEMTKSARFITNQLDLINSQTELMVFLERLIKNWPVYRNVYINFKSEETQKADEAKLSELQNKLKQFINIT